MKVEKWPLKNEPPFQTNQIHTFNLAAQLTGGWGKFRRGLRSLGYKMTWYVDVINANVRNKTTQVPTRDDVMI